MADALNPLPDYPRPPSLFPDQIADDEGKITAEDGDVMMIGSKQWVYRVDTWQNAEFSADEGIFALDTNRTRPGRWELKVDLGPQPDPNDPNALVRIEMKPGLGTQPEENAGSNGGTPTRDINVDIDFDKLPTLT